MPRPDISHLLERSYYHHWHQVDIRIADLDDQHHVNNAVFAVYCEEGRRALWQPMHPRFRDTGLMMFIARLSIDFHKEMDYPGTVAIGTAVSHIGNTSYTFAQALFTDRGCHATVDVVSVVASGQTRRPIPIPAELRSFLQQYRGGVGPTG